MKTLLLAVLIFFGALRQSYGRDFQEVEGHEFQTPGGSICNYHSLHDPTEQMTAINIHCHCKSNDELFKYSCTYQGGVKDCPKYKENRKIFYTEMIEIFEKKEKHACMMDEIDIRKHTSICKEQPIIFKRKEMEGDDPIKCIEYHEEL